MHGHTQAYTQDRISASINYEVCGQAQPSADFSIKRGQSLRPIEAFNRKLTRADPALVTVVFHREIVFKCKQQMGGKFASGDLNVTIFFRLNLTVYLQV